MAMDQLRKMPTAAKKARLNTINITFARFDFLLLKENRFLNSILKSCQAILYFAVRSCFLLYPCAATAASDKSNRDENVVGISLEAAA
jgi:hypothetical protein